MAVIVGAKPLADFTQPLEMMQDCHRRVEHFLGVLRAVERDYGAGELNEEARRALEAALDYFTNFAPHHTADEEESLFPRMRRSDHAEVRAALAELDRLEREHRRGETCHALVDSLVRVWLDTGRLHVGPRLDLRKLLDELAGTYAEHIRLEDERVFVLAGRILNEDELREIGEEMKQRRMRGGVIRTAPAVVG